jgi:hypothetical protein
MEAAPMNAGEAEHVALVCPHCKKATDSLKRYGLSTVLFFFVGTGYKDEEVTACPSCMRGQILKNTVQNVITANLFFPIPAFFNVCLLLATYVRGHSRSIRHSLKPVTEADRTAALADAAMEGAGTGAVVGFLLGSLAGLLGGAIGKRMEEAILGPLGGEHGAMIGAPLVGCLVALLFAGRLRQIPVTLGWACLGAGGWTLARLLGGGAFEWAVGDPALHWAIVGVLAVSLGAARSLPLVAATTPSDRLRQWFVFGLLLPLPIRLLVRFLAPSCWKPPLAGAVGAALPAALGGAVLGTFHGNTLIGVLIGAGAGLLAGAAGGLAVSRSRPRPPGDDLAGAGVYITSTRS